ncbi:MAG: protein-L-isoaspartate(D-aspartate) O-methyltransferase [Desulfitobacteriaceae bacterium]|nr:protein-L-isoaspartate(D-aspartate) O-methyltransferase [Desulfitobacteriaceae bacterium]MDD4345931.1 protein-L-isoaspartate(D-aspartate) O-methyltransferase [Desulfitobacteriaceae bacterium]MDD4401039.1 protein-L-isoaspartate(D-aspartate) O-methyltransferase [Desulfitobacteriaceae bacterium]
MIYHKLRAFYQKLDRSFFIDNEYQECAYLDRPLPIGHGQTISQPSLVLEMTRILDLNKNCKVLEIGTGSGYQTVLLAEFSGTVYTVERIRELSEKAKEKLDILGYTNILYKVGDGSEGWSEQGPFDRIIVTAAAEIMPDELIIQLKPEGKMLIPLGPREMQELMFIQKDTAGKISSESLGKVVFVEMKGKYGFRSTHG